MIKRQSVEGFDEGRQTLKGETTKETVCGGMRYIRQKENVEPSGVSHIYAYTRKEMFVDDCKTGFDSCTSTSLVIYLPVL